MRKKQYGNVAGRLGENQKEVTWHKGRRSVRRYKVRADKNGEVYSVSSYHTFNFGGLLKIIALVLLSAALISSFTGSSEKTFYGFLVMLQDIPEIFPIQGMIDYFTLQDFSGYPDWIAWFFEFGSGFMSLLLFFTKGLLSAISLIFYFCRWLFV